MNLPDLEAGCIGALAYEPDLLALVPRLRGRHFTDPRHEAIFEAVEWANGQPGVVPDGGMVLARLTATDRIRGNLDAGYLADLISAAPLGMNVRWYAQQVLDAARRRALVDVAREAAVVARSSADDELLAEKMGGILAGLGELAAPVQVSGEGGRIVGYSTLAEFVDAPDDETGAWVIPGLLRALERVVMVAPEGSGKSMLARAVALGVAAGRHPFAPSVRIPPARSLIVDLENPPGLIRAKCAPIVGALRAWGGFDESACTLWSRPGGIDLRKAADALLFERVVELARPRLVAFGPIYKAFTDGREDRAETSTREVMAVLDRLREKYGFALWVEHHAPLESGGTRKWRPFGSSLWLRWPEFGLALPFSDPADPRCTSLTVARWRGDRDEREWPSRLDRGTRGWPWEASWELGVPVWMREAR